MINLNRNWFDNSMQNGIDIAGMITGNVERSQGFGETLDKIKLETSKVPNAIYFDEVHTGIDFGPGGSWISIPGGYWEFIEKEEYAAIYRLYGSDLKMRINHIDSIAINNLIKGTIYGGINDILLPYPTESYGSGSGAHTHIDMTLNLPYNGYYTRQFVNPETLRTKNWLEFQYRYYDINEYLISDRSNNFRRY